MVMMMRRMEKLDVEGTRAREILNPDDDKLSDTEWETEKPGVERAVKPDNTR